MAVKCVIFCEYVQGDFYPNCTCTGLCMDGCFHCYKLQKDAEGGWVEFTSKTKPNSCCRCPVKWQEAMGISCNKRNSVLQWKSPHGCVKHWNGCPRCLWNFCYWRFSEFSWTTLWASWSDFEFSLAWVSSWIRWTPEVTRNLNSPMTLKLSALQTICGILPWHS